MIAGGRCPRISRTRAPWARESMAPAIVAEPAWVGQQDDLHQQEYVPDYDLSLGSQPRAPSR
jgi:hypothetical protein